MYNSGKTGIWTSWNGRVNHAYEQLLEPRDLESLADSIRSAASVRVLGTGKSSADICAGTQTLVSMENLGKVLVSGSKANPDGTMMRYVQAEAGIMLGDLLKWLEERNLGIPTLPDIDAITLGGALSTGTHGTGREGLSLSDYLIGCTMVDAQGKVVHSGFMPPDSPLASLASLAEGPDLDALRVSLGLLGVLYAPVLRVEALFNLALEEKPQPNEIWEKDWPVWQAEHDFTRVLFLPHTGKGWTILGKAWTGNPPFGALPPPAHHKSRRKTSQRLYRWFAHNPGLTALANRFLGWRYFSGTVRKLGTLYRSTVTTSRAGLMVLAEWAISFEDFPACFAELRSRLEEKGNPAGAHIPMDVRFYRKSTAWLSNARDEDTVSLGCVCRVPEAAGGYRAFDLIEEVFLKHGGRPHWAKYYKAPREVIARSYPRYNDFVSLRRTWDPEGKFLNSWLANYFA